MKMKKISSLLLLAGLCLAPTLEGQEKARTTTTTTKTIKDDSTSKHENDSRWSHTSTDEHTHVQIDGRKVQFNDDYTDVERIASDGYFRITEERNGTRQRLEVTPEADGSLKRVYSRGGEVRPFDSAARAWLAGLLADAVAGSGYDAEARVGKILRKSGVAGVLAEMGRLKGDYARRVYASFLLDQGNLNAAQLAKLLSQNSRALTSDYEKATLLIKILKFNLTDRDVRAAFFSTLDTLSSDYERGRVLAVLLKRDDLAAETIMLALKSVGGMSSDFEKANVLIRASKTGATNETVRAAIIEAAHTLGSDYERGRVLTAATKKQ
jgi:hypothetical protein